jgi:hypothetical protein
MPEMSCSVIRNLAEIFVPIIRWDGNERFFPVQAESWLTHCSHEDWQALPPDSPRQRGTALLKLKPNATRLQADDVLARCAGPKRIRLQVGDDPFDIGNPRYSRPGDYPDLQGADLFLDVAGWNSPSSLAGVELTYLEQLFSTLGNQLNPTRVANVTLGPQTTGAPPPDFGPAPQPATATVYAEVEWAGMFAAVDAQRAGQPDFDQVGRDALKNYLALSYYFLYPASEPPPNPGQTGTAARRREGQWEAVTFFFRGEPGTDLTAEGRPKAFRFSWRDPTYVVCSQGYDEGLKAPADGIPRAECRPWSTAGHTIDDPAAFSIERALWVSTFWVSSGTHRHLFAREPRTTTEVGGSTHIEMTSVGTPMDPGLSDAGTALVIGGAATGNPLAVIIGLILLLAALLSDHPDPDASEIDPIPPGPEVVSADGSGPAGTPTAGTPAPAGSNAAYAFGLRVVDRFQVDPASPPDRSFPPAAGRCEHPSWWDYTGRWGVRVVSDVRSEFDSGARRVDAQGRSRAYWNANAMVRYWATNTAGFGP